MGKKSKKKKSKNKISPPSTYPSRLDIGDIVTLKDLKAAHYNGKSGKVVSLPSQDDTEGRYGVLLNKKNKPIAIKPQNISTNRCTSSYSTGTDELRKQYERHCTLTEADEGEVMNAHQLALTRTMMSMFMTEEIEKKMFGRKIEKMPNFYEEMRIIGFPYKVGTQYALDYLRLSYEQNQGLPHMFEVAFTSPKYNPSPKDIMKRLGTNDHGMLSWYFGPKDNSTKIFTSHLTGPYAEFLRHSFSNQSYRKEALCVGTSHVAVGFVDLGILFAADLISPPSQLHQGPLKFIGIEKSPYSVAKTLVVWGLIEKAALSQTDMIRSVRRVVQVWFSSTWDEDTVESVKDILTSLTSTSLSHTRHPEVANLLNYWRESPQVSVQDARDEISKATGKHFSDIGTMSRREDRIAIAQYELTKDFGLQGIPAYGNLFMFSCPDSTPPLGNDENIFSAFDFKDIMNVLITKGNGTIIDAATDYAFLNVQKMISWTRSGKIELELHCADIQDSIGYVASQTPWTISWSNVLDYFDHASFHTLARECSINGDTIHFGYSMNWSRNVFGTNIIDFTGENFTALRKGILEGSNQNAANTYTLFGWDRYLRLPPPQNPINTTSSYFLEYVHFKDWCDYFFDIGRVSGPCNVGNVEHIVASPLSSTGSSTVYFTWTYDQEIKFNNVLT